jgi:hypothetical protein
MKTIKYLLFSAVFGLLTVSCYNMDILPKNTTTDEVLLTSDAGIQKYFAIAYHDLPIEDFNFFLMDQDGFAAGYTVTENSNNRWVGQKGSPAGAGGEASNRSTSYGGFDYWDFRGANGPYYRIREINNFIQGIEVYRDNYTADQFNAYIAEARFLRAFYYFGIVKFHGGCVLLDKPLDPSAPEDELLLPRSTEYDSWKFIYEDLKFAMENGEKDKGRADFTTRGNRYAAAALMTRAMLYAGTIAKYDHYAVHAGEATTLGLQGMSSDKAAEFFQYVLDAGKVVEEGGFALNTGADKALAFAETFVNYTNEDIFVKKYALPKDGTTNNQRLFHSWDSQVLPYGDKLSTSGGCTMEPAWNLVSLYEHPAIVDADGNPVRFDSPDDFWNSPEMEPRARGTVYFSGMTEVASGTKLDFQAGVYLNYPGAAADGTSDNPDSTNEYTGSENNGRRKVSNSSLGWSMEINGESVQVTGAHGVVRGGDEGGTQTGMAIRKYVDNSPTAIRELHSSVTPWKVLRYGEVLMNCAEAAYELGLETGNEALKQEAFGYIAQIRDRAGATPYEMKSAPADLGMTSVEEGGLGYMIPIDENLQFIRDERARELAFENHRIFDMKRWRVADLQFRDNYYIRALMLYKVLDEGKWIFLAEVDPQDSRTVNFGIGNYYRQIPGGAIERNPNLIPNDNY